MPPSPIGPKRVGGVMSLSGQRLAHVTVIEDRHENRTIYIMKKAIVLGATTGKEECAAEENVF